MRIIDRYIASAFLSNFLLAVVSLAVIFIFQALIGELIDGQYPARQLLYLYILKTPELVVLMTPPAVLLATVLTIAGLNRNNELVACFSIGIGMNRLLVMLLSLVFIISCFSLVMQDRILPPVYKKRTTYYWRVMRGKTDFFLDVKQDKIWYRAKNLIYNLRTFDAKSRTIHGMSVYHFDSAFNLTQLVSATRAAYTPRGWKLMDGTVTTFPEGDPFPKTIPFKERELVIPEKPKDFQEIEKEVDGLRLKELYQYIARTRTTGTDTKSFEVKFHSRISMSFIPLVMCILGVPFAGRNRREGGLARDLGACLGATFFYWLFYSVGLSLGSNGALPPVLAAWLPSVIFGVGAVALLVHNQKRV